MRRIKKLLSILIVMTFISNYVQSDNYSIYANVVDNRNKNDINEMIENFENPLYKGLDIKGYSPKDNINSKSVLMFNSLEEAAIFLRDEMVDRKGSVSFILPKSLNNDNIMYDIFGLATEDHDTGNSNEGDYLDCHWTEFEASLKSYSNTQMECNFKITYLSTYEQEQQVDKAVKEVLDNLNIQEKDDYIKIKLIHDYIVQNIRYDYTYENYSAYNAIIDKKVVCQGFSTLTYKMLKEAGLKVRIIRGTGAGGPHAWNIVKLGDKWYNIDNTWDSCYSESGSLSYEWFLKDNNDFPDHTRDLEYNTSEFNEKYPMATAPYNYISPTSITLNKTSLSLDKGNEERLIATINPSDASNKEVIWSSSDENIVKVDEKGTITAVGAGTATVTVETKDKCKKATCEVTVLVPVKSVKLNKTSLLLIKGDVDELVPIINPSDASNKEVIWSSSDENIVKVNEKGTITGVGAGTATVTVETKDQGKKATCNVTVLVPISIKIPVESVELNKTLLSLDKGNEERLIATINPSDASNKEVIWSSNDENIVKVDEKGTITGVGAGIATVTVETKDQGKKATCNVTVLEPITSIPVKSVKLNKKLLSLDKGNEERLIATINPSNASNKEVIWSSSNEEVVKVDENGKLTGVGAGEATIIVETKNQGKIAKCKVTVVVPVTSIAIENEEVEDIVIGDSITLKANVNEDAANKAILWSSSDPKRATVDSKGKVKAKGSGDVTITATSKDNNSIKATWTTKVVKHITILKQDGEELIDEYVDLRLCDDYSKNSIELTAKVNPYAGTDQKVEWKSSKPKVATVKNGKIEAEGKGTATITVKSLATKKSVKFKVNVIQPVTSVNFDKEVVYIKPKKSLKLKPVINPSDASNKGFKLESSNPDIASVKNGKVIAGSNAGETTITITTNDGDHTAKCKVIVTNPITSVELNESNIELEEEQEYQLIARVNSEYSDYINEEVIWSSNKKNTVSVDKDGKIKALKKGKATIIVKTVDGGKTAKCTVNVK